MPALALPYLEHLGTARRAYSLSSRLTILHGYSLGVLHLLLGTALHTIPLHSDSPFLFVLAKQASTKSLSCQDGEAQFSKIVCTSACSEAHQIPD